jgi:cytochrome c peroxidase
MKHLAAVAVVVFAAIGCDKKKDPGAGSGAGTGTAAGGGTGTGTGSVAIARPSQGTLPQLQPLALPDDPKRAEKIALGHALYFDKRLSGDGSRSCYACHLNEDGTGGHDPIAIGAGDKPLTRHSPVMWNVAYQQGAFYWDGRAKTLENQIKAALEGGNMGVGTEPGKLDAKAAEIGKIAGYKKLFAAAFPDAKEIEPEHVIGGVAEYIRSALICKDTAYDKFAAGDKSALGEAQQRGLDLFLGKAQCAVCHAPPHFSSSTAIDGGQYHNVGIGTDKPEAEVDPGRGKITSKPEDWAAFKPPTLRNVSKTPPYFHDGSVADLAAAVKLMATGGKDNKNKSKLIADRALTDAELADLVAFLGGLECPGALEEPTLPK